MFVMHPEVVRVGFVPVALGADHRLFLAACLLAYAALKNRIKGRRHWLETLAEELFFTALVFMIFINGFIIYEFA